MGGIPMRVQTTGSWLLAFVIPAILWSAYVYVSRMTRLFSPLTDYSVLATVLLLGVVGILLLYRAPGIRVFVALGYLVIAGSLMYGGMLASTCHFGDCPW